MTFTIVVFSCMSYAKVGPPVPARGINQVKDSIYKYLSTGTGDLGFLLCI